LSISEHQQAESLKETGTLKNEK